MDTLLAMTVWQTTLSWLMIGISGLLMLVVLIQKGRGTGLAGALGGGGGGAVFGAKTGDVFTGITIGLTAVLFIVVIACNFVFDMSGGTPTAVAAPATSTVPITVPAGAVQVPMPTTLPGMTPPAPAAGTGESKPEGAAPTEPKSDEPKSDEPKSDEPKPDEPKPDEPKSDEPKTEEPETAGEPGTGGGRA